MVNVTIDSSDDPDRSYEEWTDLLQAVLYDIGDRTSLLDDEESEADEGVIYYDLTPELAAEVVRVVNNRCAVTVA